MMTLFTGKDRQPVAAVATTRSRSAPVNISSADRPGSPAFGSTLSVALFSPPPHGHMAAVEAPSTAVPFVRTRTRRVRICKTWQAGRTDGPRSAVTPERTTTPVLLGKSAVAGSESQRQPPFVRGRRLRDASLRSAGGVTMPALTLLCPSSSQGTLAVVEPRFGGSLFYHATAGGHTDLRSEQNGAPG